MKLIKLIIAFFKSLFLKNKLEMKKENINKTINKRKKYLTITRAYKKVPCIYLTYRSL